MSWFGLGAKILGPGLGWVSKNDPCPTLVVPFREILPLFMQCTYMPWKVLQCRQIFTITSISASRFLCKHNNHS